MRARLVVRKGETKERIHVGAVHYISGARSIMDIVITMLCSSSASPVVAHGHWSERHHQINANVEKSLPHIKQTFIACSRRENLWQKCAESELLTALNK